MENDYQWLELGQEGHKELAFSWSCTCSILEAVWVEHGSRQACTEEVAWRAGWLDDLAGLVRMRPMGRQRNMVLPLNSHVAGAGGIKHTGRLYLLIKQRL